MALIPLQYRFADLLRARQPALVRPAYEQAQRILAVLHGALRVIFLPLPPAEPEHMIVKAVGIARVAHGEPRLGLALARHGRSGRRSERIDRKSTRLELQSLMRISYAVFCLKTKTQTTTK